MPEWVVGLAGPAGRIGPDPLVGLVRNLQAAQLEIAMHRDRRNDACTNCFCTLSIHVVEFWPQHAMSIERYLLACRISAEMAFCNGLGARFEIATCLDSNVFFHRLISQQDADFDKRGLKRRDADFSVFAKKAVF